MAWVSANGLTVKATEDKNLKPGRHRDRSGLYLRVGPDLVNGEKGARYWEYRYMIKGRRRWMGLGSLTDVDLHQARAKAEAARRLVKSGIDPIEHGKKIVVQEDGAVVVVDSGAKTFRQVAEEFMRLREPEWKSDVHRLQWQQTMRDYVYPDIGEKTPAEVTVDDMQAILGPIWTTKIETAKRVRGRVEAILAFAAAKGLCKGANPADLIKAILANSTKVKKLQGGIKNHAAVAVSGMSDFVVELRDRTGTSALALEFAILTAARTGDVIKATWNEFDLDKKVWSIPAIRMKANEPHLVPLTDAAIRVLRSLPKGDYGDWVFPGGKPGQKLSNMAMLTLIKKMGYKATTHGMRAVFYTWAIEQPDCEPWVADACLAHKLDNRYDGAYIRTTLFDKRRALLERWAEFCDIQLA